MGTYQENDLTRNLSGHVRPQSSQLAEPLWTDPGVEVELVLVGWSPHEEKEKNKRLRRGVDRRASPLCVCSRVGRKAVIIITFIYLFYFILKARIDHGR